ncbi:hypothetical protein L9F63_027731, partial [Diploptera punctata]
RSDKITANRHADRHALKINKNHHAQRDALSRPQYALEMSMFMCPAVHTTTRNLLRSSSTHEPSDPP